MQYENEIDLLTDNLCGHVEGMVYCLRKIPADQFDYAPAPPAPTPRILATHTYHWLVCDRQHIEEPDAARHPRVPDVPTDPAALCDALAAEIAKWRALLGKLTPEDMLAPRSQFNEFPMNVRGFVGHMLQNCIYKNGQLMTLFFALGLDGTEPYDAPFPNTFYEGIFGTTATAANPIVE